MRKSKTALSQGSARGYLDVSARTSRALCQLLLGDEDSPSRPSANLDLSFDPANRPRYERYDYDYVDAAAPHPGSGRRLAGDLHHRVPASGPRRLPADPRGYHWVLDLKI